MGCFQSCDFKSCDNDERYKQLQENSNAIGEIYAEQMNQRLTNEQIQDTQNSQEFELSKLKIDVEYILSELEKTNTY